MRTVRYLKLMGIDEAGRGAVLGPMAVCGLVIDKKDEKKLKKIGVKDSKELTPKKRKELAKEINKIAEHVIIFLVPPCQIDKSRRNGTNLNQLEAIKMAEIINMINPDKVIVDAPSHNNKKFRDYLRAKLDNKKIELICENFADKNHPVVSAASIMAKVERDRKIEELKKKVNYQFGVGYSHDPRTIEFLEKLAKENKGKMPSYVRQTWETVESIKKKYEQKGIFSFLKKLSPGSKPCT